MIAALRQLADAPEILIESLHQIDQGKQSPRRRQVSVSTTATRSTIFEGTRTITQMTNCSLSTATEMMKPLSAAHLYAP